MAAPTQEYPAWLTPIPTVVTGVNGVPTTSTTIMFLPLTYYGPSIPLGPDWTYGGLTPPPSTSTTSTSSAIPSTTSSTTTSSSSPLSTATSSSTTTPVTPASSSSTAVIPTITSSHTGGSRLTRGQLVGVIVASVLGFIFLLVLILAAYLFLKGKRRRSSANDRNLGTDYAVVPREGGSREPGEGSPRHSGEEGDSFLRPSGYARGAKGKGKAGPSRAAYTEVGVKPPVPPKSPRVPAPPATTSNLASSNSSRGTSSNPSQNSKPSVGSSKSEFYGTLLVEGDPARIENRIGPIREEHEYGMSGGAILTPEQMEQLNDESVLPPGNGEGEYSGAYAYSLLPPPRLVNPTTSSPEFTLPRPPFGERPSGQSHRSSSVPPDADENPTLLTARRVRIEELGPRSPTSSPVTEEADTSRASTSFLGAIASRLTWRRSQSPRSSQQQPLLQSSPLSDSDIEHGRLRALPAIPQMTEVARTRAGTSTLGLGPDGSRPISSVSGKSQNSGGTIYHDALSSLPGTPSLSPLPRAATPSDVTPSHTPPPSVGPSGFQHRPSVPSQLGRRSPSAPPPEQQAAPAQTDSPAAASFGRTLASGIDILDMPAPSALSSFGSSSSEATIVNYVKPNIFQPRLGVIPTPKSWADLSTGTIPSPGSFAGDQDNGIGIGITIDALEEEPPTAGEGWRSMASAAGDSGDGEQHGRRTTFGLPQYVHQQDLTSEQASLYSMRSHLTSSSPPRSTGSAPVSRRDLSYGSNSSRPSARSTSDGSSNLLSFARSGSITSDDRKRGLAHGGPISPALSAFNNRHTRNTSGSGSDGIVLSRDGSLSGNGSASHGYGHELGVISEDGGLQSPIVAHLAPAKVGSGSGSAVSSPPMSPLSMPWVGGLDEGWSASS